MGLCGDARFRVEGFPKVSGSFLGGAQNTDFNMFWGSLIGETYHVQICRDIGCRVYYTGPEQ